jgi:dTDP-4-amino-4,6-dideoxygalactose transaminase
MTPIRNFRLALDSEEEAAVLGALRSGELAIGADIDVFEHELARETGVAAAAAVSSGFAALHLALVALGVGDGDEVIMPCVSTCAAIRDAARAAGAIPVFADTNRDDLNIDPASVRECITPRTRAIIAPHHLGIISDIDALKDYGVPVIEDCAQAVGVAFRGRPVGSLGTLSIFSFYATKLLTSIDGGAVAGDPDLIATVRDRRYYGGHWDDTPRFNYKMQNAGAALGRVQLRKLHASNERRNAIGATYASALADCGAPAGTMLHRDPDGVRYRFGFRVRADRRAAVREALEQVGVPSRPEVGFLTADTTRFPAAAQLAAEVLTLPTYPALTDDEVERIASTLRRVFATQENWIPSCA